MNKERITIKKSFHLTLRAYGIWWQHNPKIFISIILERLFSGALPYVAIFFTARLLDEIAGNQDGIVLRNITLLALTSALILGILVAIFKRFKTAQTGSLWRTQEIILGQKMLKMDYVTLDNPKTKELKAQIIQNSLINNGGLLGIVWFTDKIIGGFITIIGAAVLTFSFITSSIRFESNLPFLNNPIILILMFVLMIVVTISAPFLANLAEAREIKFYEFLIFGNRFFGFLGWDMADTKRQLDVRMNEQDKMVRNLIEGNTDFGDSVISKERRYGLSALYNLFSSGITQLFMVAVYLFIGLKAWAGAFGVGAMTQYISAVTAMSGGVLEMLGAMGQLKNNAEFLVTVFEFLDAPNPMYQGSLTVEKRDDNKYEIQFKNVSFRYPGTENDVLKNLNYTFTTGNRLAIVGENGSGKTTFIKLLCRLYDPTEGEILLNGIDIRKYNYEEYLNIFSVVFQDFGLLSFSLGENVAAKMDYDRVLVEQVLEKAGFSETLDGWNDGLQTKLNKDFDEKGVVVSGGEAQKIALARALYKDAAFIIMDEPTAALDPIAEYEVYSKMNEMTAGKTAVFISHRLSSCRFCQNILVFGEGALLQQGSHDELLADEHGKYFELWHAQAQYYV